MAMTAAFFAVIAGPPVRSGLGMFQTTCDDRSTGMHLPQKTGTFISGFFKKKK
jgi:hypothetical protein